MFRHPTDNLSNSPAGTAAGRTVPFWLSLKTRLAFISSALAALLTVGIAIGSLYYVHGDLRRALEDQQDSIVKLTAGQLDTAMEDRINLLTHIAPQLNTRLTVPPTELKAFLDRAIPVPDAFNAVMVADAKGRILDVPGRNNTATVSVADRYYFREVARTRTPVVVGPVRARVGDLTGIAVAVPIESDKGEFLGILTGWLDLSRSNVLVEIAHNRLGTTGFYCLVSAGSEPVYIQHPDASGANLHAMAVGDTCGVNAQPGLFEFLQPREPVIARYLMPTTGWELVAVLPAREAFGPLHAMQQRFLTLAGIALVIVAALLWLAVRHLLAPLTRLSRVVADSSRDPAAYEQLLDQRQDEIGELARAFTLLMRDVRERSELLHRSEQQLRAVTDTLPSLLSFVDQDERYVFNNAAYERAYGISLAQLRGMTVREVLGEVDYAQVKPYLQRALAGTALTFELTRQAPEYTCSEVNMRPEWSADGSRVLGVHVHVQDVTPQKQENERLARISRLDHLTQLLNRNGFEQTLQEAMARCRADGSMMALLYLDMDRFKAVNDFHGHNTGDLLLQAFGKRVQRCVRSGDTVARLGGDEFAIILERIEGPATATRIANAVLTAVSRRFFVDGVFADIDVSIGIALYRGATMPEQALMRMADALLYRAKAAGRGRYEMGPSDFAGDATGAGTAA